MSDEKLVVEGVASAGDDPEDPAWPITSWFIGPRGENEEFCSEELQKIFARYSKWRGGFASGDKSVIPSTERNRNLIRYGAISDNVEDLGRKFTNHFPFFSPRYIGHMLSDQTLPAILGYFLGMLFNAQQCYRRGRSRHSRS
jgi:hypothetical protein